MYIHVFVWIFLELDFQNYISNAIASEKKDLLISKQSGVKGAVICLRGQSLSMLKAVRVTEYYF